MNLEKDSLNFVQDQKAHFMNKITDLELDQVAEAIAAIKNGEIIVVIDDSNTASTSGDFVCAGEKVNPELINFMATHGKGLIRTSILAETAETLKLPKMTNNRTSISDREFTVSIDLIGHGCSTGISAYDRATGINKMTEKGTKPSDFARPGHIFPIIAKEGGVLRQSDQPEAAMDICKMAGLFPIGTMVEVLNEDGSLASAEQLVAKARQHQLKVISISQLVAFRMQNERIVRREISLDIETAFGPFQLIAYTQSTTGDTHLVLKKGHWNSGDEVLVRVHRDDMGIDILANLFEGAGAKLQTAMRMISQEGKGIMLIIRKEKEAKSLLEKLVELKRSKEVEVEKYKNYFVKTEEIQRDIGVGAQIIRDLGIEKIKLISNSNRKMPLDGYGLEVVQIVPLDK